MESGQGPVRHRVVEEFGIAAVVRDFDPGAIDPADCVASARRFDAERFRRAVPREVEATLAESQRDARDRREVRSRATRRSPWGRRPRGVAPKQVPAPARPRPAPPGTQLSCARDG